MFSNEIVISIKIKYSLIACGVNTEGTFFASNNLCCRIINQTLIVLHLLSVQTRLFIYEKYHNQLYQHIQIEHLFF